MITESRTRHSIRNAGVSVLGQGIVLALGFVTRTVFLQYLGVELLGVQSLLVSLLAIASVADAGVSWALMYSLYRPLREGDGDRVAAVVQHAAHWYRWISIGTAAIGVALLPFLDFLVDTRRPVEHLHLYYLVSLAGVVLQYPMYHRVLLLEADQKGYRTKLVTIAVNVLRSLLQIAVLVLWQDFLLFLALQAASAVLVNGVMYRHVGRHYNYLSRASELSVTDRRELGSSVRAMLTYRISGLALTSTGPILISAMLGAAALGYYSNYLLLVGAVLMPLEVAFNAIVPSVGNLVASGDGTASRRVFDELQLLTILLYGTSATVMALTIEGVLSLWLGNRFVLSSWVLVATVANFYLVGAQKAVVGFRGATGMFRDVRYVMAVTALVNLGLSVAMGAAFGLAGILFATLAARLFTNVWIEPVLLFRRYLPGGMWGYIQTQLSGAVVIIGVCFAGDATLNHWAPSGWPTVLAGGAVSVITVPALLLLVFGRSAPWRAISDRLLRGLGRD